MTPSRDHIRGRWLPLGLLIVAALGFLALGLGQARSDSPTFDEPVYVASGLAAILDHDLEYNAEHPPLPKALAALPVLLAHPTVPHYASCAGNDERTCNTEFVRAQLAAGSLRRVTFASRLVPLAETIAVAFALYLLATELFGSAWAGALAGLMWLASPLTLGIGHLDGTDVPFALAVTLSCWTLARWLRLRTRRALIWTGVAVAATVGTSISGALVALCAFAVVLAATWKFGRREAFARAGLLALVTWAGVWIPYIILDPAVAWPPYVIAPKPFLDGVIYLATYNASHIPGYLAGISYTGSRWWFWPVGLVIKYPAALLLLLIAGAVALFRTERATRNRALLAVGLPAVVLAAFTVASPLNIGIRLLLPVMALWAAAAASLVPVTKALKPAWRRSVAAVTTVLLAVAGAGTIVSHPNSIAWTAWPFTPAYTEVTDSNVDWGQGLYALQGWSAGKRPLVAYFGPRGVSLDQIPGARPLTETPPSEITGWVAVSASALTSSNRTELAWLRSYCPVDVLADSILVYYFAQPPEVAPAPVRPADPCPGAPQSHRVDRR